MSGLCGWVARQATAMPPETLTEAMASPLAALSPGGATVKAAAGYGLALRGDAEESSWCEHDGLIGGLIGYPRWKEQSLRDAASLDGQAAALLLAYRRHGRDLLEQLQGHFVFAIVEPARGKAFCAIDRFGVYRLCYASPSAGSFAFATSADAVRAFPGVRATIAPQTLYQYLYFIDRVAAPGTIYDEQQKLRAGEALSYEDGELRCWRYWRMDYRRTSTQPKAEQLQALGEHLETAVSRCLADEDLGRVSSFLSGGLDSSSVAGYLAKVTGGKGRCVTIGFEHADFDETHYARTAAEAFGLRHEVFTVGPDEVLASVARLSSCFDEPYSNSSVIPSFYCAQVSREAGDAMILAGDGGDELFGGNTRYLKDSVFDHYQKVPSVVRRGILEPALAQIPWPASMSLFRRARNYIAMAQRSVADRMTSQNAFAEVPADQIFSAEALAEIDPDGPRQFAEALYEEAVGDDKIQKMMNFDLQFTLADSDLRKVLTSCMAAGIRVRFPMLDDDLAEFSATIPSALLMEGGRIRQFYKEALSGMLPDEIIRKPKQGFGLPMFQYIEQSPELAEFFCDALQSLTARRLFCTRFVEGLIEAIRSGRPGIYSGIAWDLAVLETWMAAR